ncbi:MAG: hypothetical protein K5840_01805 [Eubacterium sp.]|nr:hypothetical protein [Eubacterium sp.]
MAKHKDSKENPCYEDERKVNWFRRSTLKDSGRLDDYDRYWQQRRELYFSEMYKRTRPNK